MQASLPFLFLMTNLPMQTNSILHLTGGTFFLFPVLLGYTCHSSSPGMLLLKYLKSREIVLLLLDTYVYSPHLVIFPIWSFSAPLPLQGIALTHINVSHTPMLIKENINWCLYLTMLITSIMYTCDSAIRIRNQTLSLVYLLHLFSKKKILFTDSFQL